MLVFPLLYVGDGALYGMLMDTGTYDQLCASGGVISLFLVCFVERMAWHVFWEHSLIKGLM